MEQTLGPHMNMASVGRLPISVCAGLESIALGVCLAHIGQAWSDHFRGHSGS